MGHQTLTEFYVMETILPTCMRRHFFYVERSKLSKIQKMTLSLSGVSL